MGGRRQAVARHLIFVLENGHAVVQRAANLVESLETGERWVFSDFERDHSISDEELLRLQENFFILDFDDTNVWLPPSNAHFPELGKARYYFLDTNLSPPYLAMVRNLLETSALSHNFEAKVRMGRVAIVGTYGDPFANLPEADQALTLIKGALGSELVDLRVDSIAVDTTEEGVPNLAEERYNLFRETPSITLEERTVVVIENDVELAETLTIALENLGIATYVAHTGEDGLMVVIEEEPDLVVINLSLEDMHGYEVIAKIRKDPVLNHAGIIAMSSLKSEQDVVFALNVAKVDDYLVKPIGTKALRQRIISILSRQI